ncbi:hypothetical protein QBC35DRAFT_510811 [Podospora australis]|uniref:Uncharacterized protein n=1 Tax=Podospora australis TaxID=1536484 RepID=A0AAN6WHP3_9PEZI|nr:hypothetical protein QBC35DRAFT_510811 [Podospora australis]
MVKIDTLPYRTPAPSLPSFRVLARPMLLYQSIAYVSLVQLLVLPLASFPIHKISHRIRIPAGAQYIHPIIEPSVYPVKLFNKVFIFDIFSGLLAVGPVMPFYKEPIPAPFI